MDDAIIFTNLNDFIFCPASIYFHNLYGNQSTITYQSSAQINGTEAHSTIDSGSFSTKANIMTAVEVYCEKYNLVGKIDVYDTASCILTERKNKVVNIYDGYVFQLYAQYFALCEMGYFVKKLRIHSLMDNKNYDVKLPSEDPDMLNRFEEVIMDMKEFDITNFVQTNKEKCRNCIYEPACDRGIND